MAAQAPSLAPTICVGGSWDTPAAPLPTWVLEGAERLELDWDHVSLQRIEGRVAALQNAVDEYYKAKNEFAAKVSGVGMACSIGRC